MENLKTYMKYRNAFYLEVMTYQGHKPWDMGEGTVVFLDLKELNSARSMGI